METMKEMDGVNDIKRIDRVLEHSGSIVDFYTDTMQFPNGNTAKWDFIKHRGAAAIVVVDEEGKLIMVRQYRAAIEKYTIEIPAGGLNEGEDMKTAAMRECQEETGYQPVEAHHLLDLFTTVAFCNEKIGIYYTNQIVKATRNLDEDEFVNVERYSLEELVQLILDGTIQDSKTIAAILAYKTKMGL